MIANVRNILIFFSAILFLAANANANANFSVCNEAQRILIRSKVLDDFQYEVVANAFHMIEKNKCISQKQCFFDLYKGECVKTTKYIVLKIEEGIKSEELESFYLAASMLRLSDSEFSEHLLSLLSYLMPNYVDVLIALIKNNEISSNKIPYVIDPVPELRTLNKPCDHFSEIEQRTRLMLRETLEERDDKENEILEEIIKVTKDVKKDYSCSAKSP